MSGKNDWSIVQLGDVCGISIGRTPARKIAKYWKGPHPWASIRDLNNDPLSETAEGITDAAIRECRCRLVEAGTLLFSFKLTIGKMAIARRDLYTNEAIAALTPNESVDQTYLRFALSIVNLTEGAGHAVKGKTLNSKSLAAIRFSLPPLPEQRAIAGRLTAQMQQVAAARTAAQARLAAAEALQAGILREVFHEDVMADWAVHRLGEVSEVRSGATLGRKPRGEVTRELPYLRVANVKDGYLDLDHVKTIAVTDAEAEKWRLEAGDLLLTEGGDEDKLGRGTLWRGELPHCLHQNHIFRVRLDTDHVLPEFGTAQLSSPYGKRYFLAHAKRTTGIASINQKVLKNFPFRLPDLDTQRRVSDMIGSRQAASEEIEAGVRSQLTAIDALPGVLLREVFGG